MASLETYECEWFIYRPVASSLQMDEVYDGRDGVGKCESPRVPGKSCLPHQIYFWSLSNHTRTMHPGYVCSIYHGQLVLCFSSVGLQSQHEYSASQQTIDHGKWAVRSTYTDSALTQLWREMFGVRGVTYPARITKRWKLQVSWFVQLTTKIDSRARATWSSVFFHNLKTKIQKIWKKKM
jgi:hypothetical protein